MRDFQGEAAAVVMGLRERALLRVAADSVALSGREPFGPVPVTAIDSLLVAV
jgi:hypothetical protein